MKKIFNVKASLGVCVAAAALLASCSDEFLQEKKNYDNTTSEIYNYYSGANNRLSDLYQACNPNIQATRGWQFPSFGFADEQSQMTEEYSGFSIFIDPNSDIDTQGGTTEAPEYFQGTSAYSMKASPWGVIRNINDFLEGVEAGTLSQDEKDEVEGQAYFLRAWRYYYLWRYYGGVPLISNVQAAAAESVVPRSSAKEVYEFILSDIETAVRMLSKKTLNGGWGVSDWGRVTTGTALALRSRVMLLWASPLFNRAGDSQRWENAYQCIKSSIDSINSCGYGLAYEYNPGVNGSGWAQSFLDLASSQTEGIYITVYNTNTPDLTPDYQRNNLWEQGARPSNTLGNNGKNPSAKIVDLFPMSDGKRPAQYTDYTSLQASSITYDANLPFLNRDPRFYRTFAFPGVYWRFSGDPNTTERGVCNPYTGDKYILWNYCWYNEKDNYDNIQNSSCWFADNLLSSGKGMYVRKFSDDLDVNATPNYIFNTAGKQVGFRCCQTPVAEIRYAELLLNLAEAAAMTNHLEEAREQIVRIRRRAGYGTGQYVSAEESVPTFTSANQAVAAILYERQVEFAYEGKRSEDMRRWLLFDGGTGFSAIGATPLTGFGQNTCQWLGFAPINDGQHRRENMEFRLQDKYNYNDKNMGTAWLSNYVTPAERDSTAPDPIICLGGTTPDGKISYVKGQMTRAQRDAYAVDLSEGKGGLTSKQQPLADQLLQLKEFYDTYLQRKTKKGDAYDAATGTTPLYATWQARYYFYGLTSSAQQNNPTLEQTVGWKDYQNGNANGTFDPVK